ncbi:NAD(P)H-dependent glycerol-3-phosphate dehydrogenase [Rubrivirga sp. S365]|uniref:Glycerol-3-phosphate dehydrogenase [NAD(P)+] n=1 Tax=Rubrivirga litoralis TaxID=3075598 RepID=A0ABU3BU56_9BACT|nr:MULTISPECIES: NAD(P)H-dependent glycerol-3-phosphate dehydrogenase [unclassified Rubrivirga]MDT0632812.1 NAD(P)H-dependent glycerol-3-phosphate dehydrogenase [Rubrivirga sp. F394]MDT7857503.1 NAD(P)H-dependent glycerol-3-phosphate dehydrogenase [Rubrivirga sp. S365]
MPTAPPTAVLGAGSWGTALAISLARAGHPARLWARREEAAAEIARTRRNEAYLPGADVPRTVEVSSDLEAVVGGAAVWVVAVPSQSVRAVVAPLAGRIENETVIVSVAKGIETDTLLTTSAVLRDVLPAADAGRVGVLYGPSHAEEVAQERPTSVVAALPDPDTAAFVQDLFMTPSLRVYTNPDVVGVEVGGSVKNVMAVAAGMSDGLDLGDNAKAALVTRGLAEITRLGLALGADAHTFAGLAGLGDLVVTCFSRHSRNRAFGERVGRGETRAEALGHSTMVVEGVQTTASVRALARRHGVEMPITEAVWSILFDGLAPRDAVEALMTRSAAPETDPARGPAFDGTAA